MDSLPESTFDNKLVETRPSSIHGIGLFATVDIPANSKICDYVGVERKWCDYVALYGKDYRYAYVMRRINKIISGRDNVTENPSHYCNESKAPNVILKKKGLYTLCDCQKDSELFLLYPVYYNRDYVL